MDKLDRLENKVDKLYDELSELKSDFRVHTQLIAEHVAGDKKIINEITPIIRDFQYRQERGQRWMKTLKLVGSVTAITGTLLGLIQYLG